jgi:hypothetical protein
MKKSESDNPKVDGYGQYLIGGEALDTFFVP